MTARSSLKLIEISFPLEEVSDACSREKSIRQGHISTLQQWWARRPLAVCRSAIFAALCPTPAEVDALPGMAELLDSIGAEGETTAERLNWMVAKLSSWGATADGRLLEAANRLITANREQPLTVVDTFAGGGSFPVEALRLGLEAFASDLNPVAATALRVAIEDLPDCSPEVLMLFQKVSSEVAERLDRATSRLYTRTEGEPPLAFFWCRTYTCADCDVEVPLLHDFWLSKGKRKFAVRLGRPDRSRRFNFEVYVPSAAEAKAAARGTVSQKGAECPHCGGGVTTKWLRAEGVSGRLGERLYAKLVLGKGKKRIYTPVTTRDETLASKAKLRTVRNRKHTSVPDEALDKNGIRHTWAIQYGVESTAQLYNCRQSVALLEVLHEIEKVKTELAADAQASRHRATVITLLALTFNRLVVYGNRHAWWQSNGEFPANMFGRQAIPMVWNYVEIPVNSPAASGWVSASTWIEKAARHLTRLPKRGRVWLGDAARCPLLDESADLVTIDPPYYDSIAYSYLSDIFYVWMKALLGDLLPEYFAGPMSPKLDEAIVDRNHSLAPAPKTGLHFRRKMLDAFREARRILKRDGRLIVMFGHKKFEAWDALLGPVIEAGFVPSVSYPIHTERKVKFRHGYIDALSSSCLIVCVPDEAHAKKEISWANFQTLLKSELRDFILRFQSSGLFGADLTTSLIAPACTLFRSYKVLMDQGNCLKVGELLERLPSIAAECEFDIILAEPGAKRDGMVFNIISSLAHQNASAGDGSGTQIPKKSWLELQNEHWLVGSTVKHATLLYEGRQREADQMWEKLSTQEKDSFCQILRAAALSSVDNPQQQQLAQASLGRISLRMRTSNGGSLPAS